MQKYEYKNIHGSYMCKAMDIANRHKAFTDGCRVLFLVQRHKDGGHSNNSKLRMYITRTTEEWTDALAKLLQEKAQYPEIPLRIYQTLNSRDIKKGIRTLKELQLDADYYDEDSKNNFYIDIKNRWVSALMKPCNKLERNFLFDVDTKDFGVNEGVAYNIRTFSVLVDRYETANGYHYITEPFNPNLFPKMEDVEIKKDAMMLLAF